MEITLSVRCHVTVTKDVMKKLESAYIMGNVALSGDHVVCPDTAQDVLQVQENIKPTIKQINTY